MDLLLVFHTFLFLSFFLSLCTIVKSLIYLCLSFSVSYLQFYYIQPLCACTFITVYLLHLSLSLFGLFLPLLYWQIACLSLFFFQDFLSVRSLPASVLNSTSFCLYFYQSLFTSPFYVRFWSLLVYFIFARLYFSQLAFLNILQLMLRCK